MYVCMCVLTQKCLHVMREYTFTIFVVPEMSRDLRDIYDINVNAKILATTNTT